MSFSGKQFSSRTKTSTQSNATTTRANTILDKQSLSPTLEASIYATRDNAQNKMSESFIQRKCAECKKEGQVQPKSTHNGHINISNHLSNEIQSSRGQGENLSKPTSSFMDSRMGFDFSDVRIHADNQAAVLNRELNAKAFTVGKDIYFNEGQYQPDTKNGQHLLAHELTHVMQQSEKIERSFIQRACFEEANTTEIMPACPEGSQDVGHQPQGQSNALDAKANAIISTAVGAGANSAKAILVIKDIICSYMPSQAGKVRKINYFSGRNGLETQSVGTGAGARGDICVGDDFLNTTTASGISRRVLQVAHELEHIEQYRTGMSGGTNKHLREFLAFYHEGTADEFIGTRRMQHGTRKSLIDAALGEYYCLTDADKTTHITKKDDLLARRQTVNGTNGNPSTDPPTTCRAS